MSDLPSIIMSINILEIPHVHWLLHVAWGLQVIAIYDIPLGIRCRQDNHENLFQNFVFCICIATRTLYLF